MSMRYQMKDHIMMIADYGSPTFHEHLASHIILSLGDKIPWDINGEKVDCYGVCIGPNVKHRGNMPKEGALVFLFMEVSKYGMSIKQEHLQNRPYRELPEEVVRKVRAIYKEEENPSLLDERILAACHLTPQEELPYDSRISDVIEYLETCETVSPDVFDELAGMVCLSKSRLSHLFREQTGMTLHSYLAITKLKKTDSYISEGETITEASMHSGFDSPSHCAATMKRMFGLSFREIYRTIER